MTITRLFKSHKSNPFYLLIIIMLIGFFLRIYNLGKFGLWLDEVYSLIIAKNLWWAIPRFFLMHTGFLYPALLRFWIFLGEGEFILRFLSAIFGLFSIIGVYYLGKVLFGQKIGLYSSFLLSISPFHIYYSQELRSYSLFTFLTIASVYFLIRALREDKFKLWIYFIISTILCLYSYQVSPLLIIAENIFFISVYNRYRNLVRKWVITQLIILLLFLPILLSFFNLLNSIIIGKIFFWVPKMTGTIIFQTFNVFNLGYTANKSLYNLAFYIFIFLFIFGLWSIRQKKEELRLLVICFLSPFLLYALASLLITPIYVYRTCIFLNPFYLIAIACGLFYIKKYILRTIFLISIVILSFFSLKNYYQNIYPCPVVPYRIGVPVKKEYQRAVEYIKRGYQSGDGIGHTCVSSFLPFFYYHNPKIKIGMGKGINKFKEHFLTLTPEDIPGDLKIMSKVNPKDHPLIPLLIEEFLKDIKRAWLVFSSWEYPYYSDPRAQKIKDWFDTRYPIIGHKDFVGIDIYLYQISEK